MEGMAQIDVTKMQKLVNSVRYLSDQIFQQNAYQLVVFFSLGSVSQCKKIQAFILG